MKKPVSKKPTKLQLSEAAKIQKLQREINVLCWVMASSLAISIGSFPGIMMTGWL